MLTKEIVKNKIRRNKDQIKGFGIDFIGLFGSNVREE